MKTDYRKMFRLECEYEEYSEYFEGDDVELEDTDYEPCSDDIVIAIRKYLDGKVDFDLFEIWYLYVTEYCEIVSNDYLNYDGSDLKTLFPTNENELIKCLTIVMYEYFMLRSQYGLPEEVFRELIEDVCLLKKNFKYNANKNISDWKINLYQANKLFDEYENNENNFPEEYKGLLIKTVENLIKEDNVRAMKIKAYAMYGGNDLYPCDYVACRDLLLKVMDINGDPYCANTLGYIYYYGRCTDGKPEYEKAFKYYSIGAMHNLIESRYKMADMYRSGKGTIKSETTADYIVNTLFEERFNSFPNGDEESFADVALRKAGILEKKEDYEGAYTVLLLAKYASEKRLRENDFFGNSIVDKRIAEQLDKMVEKLGDDYLSNEIYSCVPFGISAFVEGHKCRVTIKDLGDNGYHLKVQRNMENGKRIPDFIPISQLGMAGLTTEVNVMLDEPEKIEIPGGKNSFTVDSVYYGMDDNPTVVFYKGDKEMAKIVGGVYMLDTKVFG